MSVQIVFSGQELNFKFVFFQSAVKNRPGDEAV